MKRTITHTVRGTRAIDGAGVHLMRVLGHKDTEIFDPVLMLDSFDSNNPDEYTAGFPFHPHRGIETISYVSKGAMIHRDSLGNEAAVTGGEVQWMNSGSGIIHEETLPPSDELLGAQLWLNLPAQEKMSAPSYTSIHNEDIQEIKIDGGTLRLLAGSYQDHHGFKGDHLPLNYYDIQLNPQAQFTIKMNEDESIMLFTLKGDVIINGEHIAEKTAVKLSEGTELEIQASDKAVQLLYIASYALKEPIAWAGPIVMNTQDELHQALVELESKTFIKDQTYYEK